MIERTLLNKSKLFDTDKFRLITHTFIIILNVVEYLR